VPEGFGGAPTLVRDEDGREKCVSCQLCEFVCPPKAIKITPGEIQDRRFDKVEKAPREFLIDMVRCIYCGFCEEVCPEEAIFLNKDYNILAGYSRGGLVHNKQKLYEMGGVVRRPIRKWADK
jgi:NADH-quinone oxidoreductase subunit I